jgi:hypothetical protein
MSLDDTRDLGIRWCPGCEPDRDPCREILVTSWCTLHAPPIAGLDDAHAGPVLRGLSGSGEAEGADCAAVARMIR